MKISCNFLILDAQNCGLFANFALRLTDEAACRKVGRNSRPSCTLVCCFSWLMHRAKTLFLIFSFSFDSFLCGITTNGKRMGHELYDLNVGRSVGTLGSYL